jgi:hypothetical protein
MRKFRAALLALVALVTLASAFVAVAPEASAAFPYPAPGAQATLGNRAIPGTPNSESCWATYSATAMTVSCYKYNQYTQPIGNWTGTYPIEYCNGAGWKTGTDSTIWVGNWYYDASPSYPYSGMNGRAPGCGLGFEQSGSQANARNYITPVGCTGGGCTTNLGTLTGGSWWNQPGSRSQQACYLALCEYGHSIVQMVNFA